MARLLFCLLLLTLAGCGPVGVGAGIAALLDDGSNVDPTNVPQIEVEPLSLNDKGEHGIWAGPRIGLQESSSEPAALGLVDNVLPDSPYIKFEIRRTNGSVEKLKVYVKLAASEEYDADAFGDLEFLRAHPELVDDSALDARLAYLPRIQHWQRRVRSASEFAEQEYRIQFRVVDEEGRENTSAVLYWTLDATPPQQPANMEADRNATGNFLEYVRWTIGEAEREQIETYDILFLPDDGNFDADDLIDPVTPDGGSAGNGTGDSQAGLIGVWQVKEEDMNPSAPGQSTGGTLTRFGTFIPMEPHRVCLGVYVAVIAVDFANNRSELTTVVHADTSSKLCKDSGTTFRERTRESKNTQDGLDATLLPSWAASHSQFLDLNADGCPDILTIGSDGTARIAYAVCEDGKPTGEFEEEVATTDPNEIAIIEASLFSRNRDGPAELVAIGETGGETVIQILGVDEDGDYRKIGKSVELPQVADSGEPLRSEYTPVEIVTTLDIDLDGYRDILVRATHDEKTKGDFLVGYLGVGTNGRATADLTQYRTVTTQTGLQARQALFGNFNGDTLGDVALCDGEVVRVLVGAPTLTVPQRASGRYETKRTVVPDILELVDQGLAPPVVEGGPEFLAAKDLDGDGIEDVVMSNAGGSVSVLRGAADNDFGVPVSFSAIPPGRVLTALASPGAGPVVIEDLNLDGIPDLFIAGVVDNSISLLIGNGSDGIWDGTFGEAVALPVPFDPVRMSAGDVDRDGVLDITVLNEAGNEVAVLEGGGFVPSALGTFALGPVLPLPLHTADQLALLDLDGDSILDLVAAGMRTGAGIQTLFLGEGNDASATGTFGPGLTRGLGDGSILSLATADFNRDAIPDLAGASASGVDIQFGIFSEEDQRFLFESDRLYSFKPAPGATADVIAQAIAGDFNGDGIMDVVSRAAATVNVLLGVNDAGRTDGSFLFEYKTPADFLPAGDELMCGGVTDFTDLLDTLDTGLRNELTGVVDPGAMGAADFDGDGALDVVVVDEERKRLAILRNYGRDCGDGAGVDDPGFGMFEAPKLYDAFGFVPGPIVVEDLNGDGVPDVTVIALGGGSLAERFCVMLGVREEFEEGDLPSLDKFSFGVPKRAGAVGDSSAIAAADLNQDGHPEILVADKTANTLTIFFGDGTGDYDDAPQTTIALNVSEPRSIAVGDLNGDRTPDIVVGGKAGVQVIYGVAGVG